MLRRARVAMALVASILFGFVFVDRRRVVQEHYPIAVAIRIGGIALLAPPPPRR